MPVVRLIDATDDELFVDTCIEFLPESEDRVGAVATPKLLVTC
jgi:hypothetical protein